MQIKRIQFKKRLFSSNTFKEKQDTSAIGDDEPQRSEKKVYLMQTTSNDLEKEEKCKHCQIKDENNYKIKLPGFDDVTILCYKGNDLIQMHQFEAKQRRQQLVQRVKFCREGVANVWIMKELAKKAFYIKWGEGIQRVVIKVYLEPFEINGEVCGIVYLSAIKKGVRMNTKILQRIRKFINEKLVRSESLTRLYEKLQFHEKNQFDRLQICYKKRFSKKDEVKNWCYYCGFSIYLTRWPKCELCTVAKYCSFSCQKADWNDHRHDCNNKRLIIQNKYNYKYMHDWK